MLPTSVIVVLGLVHFSVAQDAMVNCTLSIFSNCTARESLSPLPYSSCCTLTDRVYEYVDQAGTCRICGPILDQEETIPTVSTGSTVVISWKLFPVSPVSPSHFVVTSRERTSTRSPVLIIVENEFFSNAFLKQTVGVEYVYSVTAFGAGGVRSPPIEIIWVAGRNLGPTLSNFRVTDMTLESVMVEWELVYNGLDPALNMTLMWDTDGVFRKNSTSTEIMDFDDELLADGTILNFTFVDLESGTRYALRVQSSNSRHTTFSSVFTFETNSSMIFSTGTQEGLRGHAVMVTMVTPAIYLFTLLIYLLLT